MMHTPLRVASILAGVLLALVPIGALAGPDDVAVSVSQKIMSPFCPGLTLHDCPSDAAAELREDIAGWARDGMSEDEIIERLEDEFGPGVLATPPKEGSGLIAWLLPIAGLLGAAVIGILLARRWTRATAREGTIDASAMNAGDRVRLEAELREIRDRA
jgi:cytochrome c-type biogenesis protein CcmH